MNEYDGKCLGCGFDIDACECHKREQPKGCPMCTSENVGWDYPCGSEYGWCKDCGFKVRIEWWQALPRREGDRGATGKEIANMPLAAKDVKGGTIGPHGMDPEECPTFYDCCHCTVENLIHNIERAEVAEAKLESLLESLRDLMKRDIRCNCPVCHTPSAFDRAMFESLEWDDSLACPKPHCGAESHPRHWHPSKWDKREEGTNEKQ